jgi:molybdopterin molybdotransferase
MSNARKLLDDCFLHDSERLRHAAALEILRSRVQPVTGLESVPLSAAAGRVLGAPVVAGHPVPAHTNAAVDGYAFASASYDPGSGATLVLEGRAAAGRPLDRAVPPGAAVRILTGAVLPDGCDTVAMQEDVSVLETAGPAKVVVPGGLKRGANVRKAGEDVRQGETLFRPGHVVRAQDLAALASVGAAEVRCHERLSVAILSTGDEILRPGTAALAPGQVYDANAPMLAALVSSAGAAATDLGIVPDDPVSLRRALAEAARRHHVILTSGGASRGEEDHMVTTLDSLGKRHMWQLAIKPGRPMTFGQIGDCVVVGLPGNPVAVFVCFLMYVWPMLRRLGGGSWPEPRRIRLPAAFEFTGRKPGRREFWRGMLVQRDGALAVDKFKRDGSGLISGLRVADGLIDIPEDAGDVRVGDPVDYIPLSEFGIIGGA